MALEKVVEEGLRWALPQSLGVPKDPLQLRLDFFGQAVQMTSFEDQIVTTKVVSAMDVAHALARELDVSSGLLPVDALWWVNTPDGAVVAIWREPQVTRVALQEQFGTPPERFTIPLPGLIFLCKPGQPPWVYAAKKRPTSASEKVYAAPVYNVFKNGRSCPGTHKYPMEVQDQPDSFLRSFFAATGDYDNRSKKHPKSIKALWKWLDGEKSYPLADLREFGTVQTLMELKVGERW